MPKVSVSTEPLPDPSGCGSSRSICRGTPSGSPCTTRSPVTSRATLGEGVTYKQRVKLMGMPAEIAWRVTTAEAPGKLELAGDGPMGVKAHNRFMIEPAGEGSQITFEMEFNGPALAGPMAGMVEKQAGAAAQQSLAKFTALLG